MPDLEAGSVFAGHRIDARAGKGGMGVVYRATDLQLDRVVALKLVSPEYASDPSFAERFKRESRLAASLDHPNVIPIYHAGEEDGQLFVTMRFVDGTDLAEVLRRDRRLAPERAVAVTGQIAAGLDAAHARGLVHRDVKPANVLLDGEHVFLTDFGLSKQADSGDDLTETGAVLGTVDYMAPEQVQGGIVDARSDVYALGCVLFQALSGRVPFERSNGMAKLFAHVSEPAPRVKEVPDALADVVARAMEKDPGRRFQSAGELAQAAADAVGVSLAPAAAAPPSLRMPRQVRSRRRTWIAAVIGVAAAAAIAIVALSGGDDKKPAQASAADKRAVLAVVKRLHQGFSEPVCRNDLTKDFRARYFTPYEGQEALNACINLGGGDPNRKPFVPEKLRVQGSGASVQIDVDNRPTTLFLVKEHGRWRADDSTESVGDRYARKVLVAAQPPFVITPAIEKFVFGQLRLPDADGIPRRAVDFLTVSVKQIESLEPPADLRDVDAEIVTAMRAQLTAAQSVLAAQKANDAKAFARGEHEVFAAIQSLGRAFEDLERAQ